MWLWLRLWEERKIAGRFFFFSLSFLFSKAPQQQQESRGTLHTTNYAGTYGLCSQRCPTASLSGESQRALSFQIWRTVCGPTYSEPVQYWSSREETCLFRVPSFEQHLPVCSQLCYLKVPDTGDDVHGAHSKLAPCPLDWSYASYRSEIRSAFMGFPQCTVMNSQCYCRC